MSRGVPLTGVAPTAPAPEWKKEDGVPGAASHTSAAAPPAPSSATKVPAAAVEVDVTAATPTPVPSAAGATVGATSGSTGTGKKDGTRRAVAGKLVIPKERPADHQRRRRRRAWCTCCGPPADFFELLNPTDFDRLVALRRDMHVPYNPSNATHVRSLLQLWACAYPRLTSRIGPRSPHWRLLGFQNDDPSTDFRGAGYYALHAMLYFASTQAALFNDVAVNGRVYPWAAAAINIVHIIRFHLGLADVGEVAPVFVRVAPSPRVVAGFVHLFVAYEHVVEKIFCACMRLLDTLWHGVLLSPVPRIRPRRRSGASGGTTELPPSESTVPPRVPPLALGSGGGPPPRRGRAAAATPAAKPAAPPPAPPPPPPPALLTLPTIPLPTLALPGGGGGGGGSSGGGASPHRAPLSPTGGAASVVHGAMPPPASSPLPSPSQLSTAPLLPPPPSAAASPAPGSGGTDDAVAYIFAGASEVTNNEEVLVARAPPSREDLTALLDFPQVLLVVRSRLDAALAVWDAESSVWASFERALLHGADGVRFRRTPVLEPS